MMQEIRPKEVLEWLDNCSQAERDDFFSREMSGSFSPSLERIAAMNRARMGSAQAQSNGDRPFNQPGWAEQSQQRKIF